MTNLLARKIWRNYPPFLNVEREEGDLYSLTEALLQGISTLDLDAGTAEKMMYLLTSAGEWVDHWGNYFNLPRLSGEPDELYKQRILWEVTRPKQTIQGIKELIIHYTGLSENEITIFEPFTQLKPTDFGATTDTTRLAGWEYWTWAVIDIRVPIQIDADLARRIQDTTKAYGVKVFITTQFDDLITFDPLSIVGETLSISNIHFDIIEVITITDTLGLTDGRLLVKDENNSLYDYILSYTTDWGEYGFGEGGFGDVPFGGRGIIYESLVYVG